MSRRRPTTLPLMLMVRPRLRPEQGSIVASHFFRRMIGETVENPARGRQSFRWFRKPGRPLQCRRALRHSRLQAARLRYSVADRPDMLSARDLLFGSRNLRLYMRRPGSFTLVGCRSGQKRWPVAPRKAKTPLRRSGVRCTVAGFMWPSGPHRATSSPSTYCCRAALGRRIAAAAGCGRSSASRRDREPWDWKPRSTTWRLVLLQAARLQRDPGTLPRYYSNGVDALVMEKNLPEPRGASFAGGFALPCFLQITCLVRKAAP